MEIKTCNENKNGKFEKILLIFAKNSYPKRKLWPSINILLLLMDISLYIE